MQRTIKIILTLIITFLLVNMFSYSYAIDSGVYYREDTYSQKSTGINPDDYKPDALDTSQAGTLISKAGIILGIIRNISVIVAVICLMLIGIKYIFGSVEEKANYKASLMPYVIGFVISIAGTTIVTFIYNAVK